MNKYLKYTWYIPALYVSYMFGNKIIEGMAHSNEFIDIISVIKPLAPFAYTLTPLVGILDLSIGIGLVKYQTIAKLIKVPTPTIYKFQKVIFLWTIVWPFIPASLRYFGGVADFEIVEVLSISISALVAYLLWSKYAK